MPSRGNVSRRKELYATCCEAMEEEDRDWILELGRSLITLTMGISVNWCAFESLIGVTLK